MPNKLLVTYATWHGSTAGVAEAIGDVLREGNIEVDVCLVQDVPEVSPYQAVVVGSAIRGGKWLPEAIQFVETNQAALSRLPVAYFLVCRTLREDTAENRQKVASYLDPLCNVVEPVDMGLFAGTVDSSKFSLLMRLLMELAKTPMGDFRDWDAIRSWAVSLRPKLMAA